MFLRHYSLFQKSLSKLQQDFPQFEESFGSIEKVFQHFSYDYNKQFQTLEPESTFDLEKPTHQTVQISGLDSVNQVHEHVLYTTFYVTLRELRTTFSVLRLFQDEQVESNLEISVGPDFKVHVKNQGSPPPLTTLEQFLQHLDSLLFRASEIQTQMHRLWKYVFNFNSLDALTLLQYRYYGDELVNQYLRGTLTTEQALSVFRRFWRANEGYPFPLESQSIQLGFNSVGFLNLVEETETRVVTRGLAVQVRKPLQEKLEELIQLFVNDLQRILSDAPRGFSVHVYRGLDVFAPSRIQTPSQIDSFMSTSTDKNVSANFAGPRCCLLQFLIQDTQPVLHFSNVVTELLLVKVSSKYPQFNHNFFTELQNSRLNEWEIIIMSNTPIQWYKNNQDISGIIKTQPRKPAVRNLAFYG